MIDLSNIPITQLLAEIRRRDAAAKTDPKSIAAAVIATESESSGIPASAILGRSRKPTIARARMRTMSALYHLNLTCTQIAAIFQVHHTTVTHACKSMSDIRTSN